MQKDAFKFFFKVTGLLQENSRYPFKSAACYRHHYKMCTSKKYLYKAVKKIFEFVAGNETGATDSEKSRRIVWPPA
jgi:hypothetical protein